MVKTLEQTVTKKLSLMDIFLVAAVKNVSERLTAPLIGNGTIFSGGVKTVAGVLASQMFKGKTGDILGTAWVVDGTEDLVNAFFGSGNRSASFGAVVSSRGSGNASTRVL